MFQRRDVLGGARPEFDCKVTLGRSRVSRDEDLATIQPSAISVFRSRLRVLM